MELIKRLEELCVLDGISGDEGKVRDYIIEAIKGKCEYSVDPLGSIIAFKKGRQTPKHKLLFSAHMDEVGLIVTHICSDGSLKFAEVGGVDPRVLFGKRVYVGEKKTLGVIAGIAVHNLTKEQRSKAADHSDLCIDIGVTSREEAMKLVRPGDSVVFDSSFLRFGEGRVKSKAIDDRAGCAMMIEMINSDLEYDTCFTFVVQEEVGLRGATAAAYTVAPDFAIVLESTTAADIPSSSGEKRVCEVGKGPVVSYMDRHTIYDRELYRLAFETADSLGIPCQTKTVVAGGNDAGAIHKSRGGVRTSAVSLPCRYLHSPSCVIAEEDMTNAYKLVTELAERIQKL
ncbi:endoglucanase [Ruminococcus sp. YE71]|uniref:M42 family metallopeptidase n=1 Tax=unclassified Ruminococcus TaxID=2608920 RepID=UPI00087F497F|nr:MULTISPECIES: M42 family metallopeptidase [unclassified Ruminococcus]SDA23811.1 endoglucanase [Ruminococcus sp. YE78]SFW40555.1 endoglucanase [Ruminococcus sp. YE71]